MALEKNLEEPTGTLYQVSIMNALLQGIYDGETTLNTLAKHGNFGLGTFNGLDGELIVFNNDFYQIRNDGTATKAAGDAQVPFAAVTDFEPTIHDEVVQPLDKAGLAELIEKLVPSENLFYAIQIEGHFKKVQTRTVAKQQKPYRPFTEVVEEQEEFSFQDLDGVLLGFFSPEYVQGVTISGYHLHFLSADRNGGGHVLDFLLERGSLSVQTLLKYELLLPEQADFEKAELSGDTGDTIKETEG